jgi:hypothetical protein
MNVIIIQNVNEIPKDVLWRCYTAEPSAESAVAQDRENYGSDPAFVFQKILPSGRSSVYIPVPEERL